MSLVKSGQIANCCQPNALMTLKEYLEDYEISQIDQDVVIALVKEEEFKQRARWGVQNLTLPEWITILSEEVGELAKAVMTQEYDRPGKSPENIVHEAIQVAMIAQKIARITIQYLPAAVDESCGTQDLRGGSGHGKYK